MKRIYFYFWALCLMALTASCKEEFVGVNNIPVLELEEPTNMGRSSVTLNGSIKTGHPKEILEYGFLFGSTSDLSGSDTRILKVNKGSLHFFSTDVDNLDYGATYYYAVYAENGFERLLSETKAVTIDKASVILSDFEQVNNTRSCFSAHIADDGGGDIRRVGFCWSDEKKDPTIYEGEFLVAELDAKTKSFELSLPLEPTKTYYVRAFVQSRITEEESLTDAYSETIIVIPGPADNEIWYTSTDGEVVKPVIIYSADKGPFDAKIVSNTYENGRGVIEFDAPITAINEGAFESRGNLLTITLPDAMETIDYNSFNGCVNLEAFYGKYSSEDNRCLVANGELVAFAPAGITEYTTPENVHTIATGSFLDCENLLSVEISSGVATIGYMAFAQCASVRQITIPESVKMIDQGAFYNCSGLVGVYCKSTTPPNLYYDENKNSAHNIYDKNGEVVDTIYYSDVFPLNLSLKIYVPDNAWEAYRNTDGWKYYAENIVSSVEDGKYIYYTTTDGKIIDLHTPFFGPNIDIVSNVYENGQGVITLNHPATQIGAGAFMMCNTLKSIVIPNSVETIEEKAFISCSNLSNITIGSGVRRIGSFAFAFSGLKEVAIPNSVLTILEGAFYECANLSTVNFGKGLVSIGEFAFGASGMTEVVIPNNVQKIGDTAFSDCYYLQNVIIGDGVEIIDVGTFAKCSSLKNLTIGRGVKEIWKNAFNQCSSLTDLTIPSNVKEIGMQAFWECSNLTNLTIENGVEIIGDAAFAECISLRTVAIPESVTSIGAGVFHTASSLAEVYCYPTIPPTAGGVNMFKNNAEGRIIFVPAESVEAYKSAPYWSDYAADIYPIGGEEEPAISFEFSVDATENSFTAVVTPDTDEYYMGEVFLKSDYESKVAQYGSVETYMKEFISTEFAGMPYSQVLPLLADYGLFVHKGSWKVSYGDMPSDTEFVIVAYLLDMTTCDALSEITTYEFKTMSASIPDPTITFEFSVDATENSFTAIVTPDTDEYYMGEIFLKSDYESKVAQYGSVETYMKEFISTEFAGMPYSQVLPLLADYGLLVHKGSWTASYGDMPSDTEFVIVAYLLDMTTCDALSEVTTYEFKTLSASTPDPSITFEISVDATESSFTAVVTPDTDEYYMGEIFLKSDYESKVAQYGSVETYMKEFISTEFAGMPYSQVLPLLADYGLLVHKGSWTASYGDMPSDTEFVIVAYLLDMTTCDALSKVTTYEFKTLGTGPLSYSLSNRKSATKYAIGSSLAAEQLRSLNSRF